MESYVIMGVRSRPSPEPCAHSQQDPHTASGRSAAMFRILTQVTLTPDYSPDWLDKSAYDTQGRFGGTVFAMIYHPHRQYPIISQMPGTRPGTGEMVSQEVSIPVQRQ